MQGMLSIIVPVYNEAEILPEVAPGVISYGRQHGWPILFINDGSRDTSGSYLDTLADASTVFVFHHKVNRGYGSALKTGLLQVNTPYCITMDADGQHALPDIEKIFGFALQNDADMVVGNRGTRAHASLYRSIGKWLIRAFTRWLMHLPVHDLNSGFKLYRTELAKKYLRVCPNSMSFSDVITLVFINQGNLILEHPITVNPRKAGKSTVTTYTAFETVLEIMNIVLMFNPLKVFLPLSAFFVLMGLAWGTYILLVVGRGVSVGAMLAIVTGLIFFVLGLLANQISAMRMESIDD